ncbi:hypothetical protein [Paralimibaculum aggregatum]|nr:hypothetical protein [Limibaculum sp. NKW23]
MTLEPHQYPNGRYKVEVEIESLAELARLARIGTIDGRPITGVRMSDRPVTDPVLVPPREIEF